MSPGFQPRARGLMAESSPAGQPKPAPNRSCGECRRSACWRGAGNPARRWASSPRPPPPPTTPPATSTASATRSSASDSTSGAHVAASSSVGSGRLSCPPRHGQPSRPHQRQSALPPHGHTGDAFEHASHHAHRSDANADRTSGVGAGVDEARLNAAAAQLTVPTTPDSRGFCHRRPSSRPRSGCRRRPHRLRLCSNSSRTSSRPRRPSRWRRPNRCDGDHDEQWGCGPRGRVVDPQSHRFRQQVFRFDGVGGSALLMSRRGPHRRRSRFRRPRSWSSAPRVISTTVRRR